jgi:hypothetical protein
MPGIDDRDRQVASIQTFAQRHEDEKAGWRRRIARIVEDGGRPVLWGAGSRGVQFLTLADPDGRLSAVVDLNPRKWGRFLPVTGHLVQSFETLADIRPTVVVITNPSYRTEIATELRRLGLDAEILQA